MHYTLRVAFTSIFSVCTLLAGLIAAHAQTTLQKVAQSGVVNVGHREASLPFSYLNSKKEPIGYSMDICAKIVKEMEIAVGKPLEINFVPVTSGSRIPMLVNGKIDLECGSTTDTPGRRKKVAFLPHTYVTGTKLLVKTYTGINSIADMNGQAVAITLGTTTIKDVQQAAKKNNVKVSIKPVKDHAEGFVELVLDRVGAYASDEILLHGLKTRAMIPEDYQIIGDFLSDDGYGIMVRKDDPEMMEVGSRAIRKMIKSGEIEKRYAYWFASLKLPMSKRLKEHLASIAN